MDLKSRFRNKAFLVSLFSAVLLLLQQLGIINIDTSYVKDIFNTVLVILTMLGVIIDPTTNGILDNKQE